jgi:hypothetical protein
MMATNPTRLRPHGDCMRIRHMPREAYFELVDLERDVELRVSRRSVRAWDGMRRPPRREVAA